MGSVRACLYQSCKIIVRQMSSWICTSVLSYISYIIYTVIIISKVTIQGGLFWEIKQKITSTQDFPHTTSISFWVFFSKIVDSWSFYNYHNDAEIKKKLLLIAVSIYFHPKCFCFCVVMRHFVYYISFKLLKRCVKKLRGSQTYIPWIFKHIFIYFI